MDKNPAGEGKMQTGSEEITPEFLRDTKQRNAAENLKAAESAAGGIETDRSDGVDGAREAENSEGLYNKIKSLKSVPGKLGIKKGKTPTMTIIGVIVSFVFFLLTANITQLFQPFSLIAQFIETFNSMGTSVNQRSRHMLMWQLSGGGVKDPVKGNKIFGKKLSVTKTQAERLRMQGIIFDDAYDDGDGGKMRVFKYTDSSGNEIVVTADQKGADKLRSNKNVNAVPFDVVYTNEINFNRAYNAGSMTWRGAIANYFGRATNNFIRRLGGRNRFSNYDAEVKKLQKEGMDLKDARRNAWLSIMGKNTEKSFNIKMRTQELEDDYQVTRTDGQPSVTDCGGGNRCINYERYDGTDENGNPIWTNLGYGVKAVFKKVTGWIGLGDGGGQDVKFKDYDINIDETIDSKQINTKNVGNKLKAIGDRIDAKGGWMSKTANLVCGAVNFVGAITLMVKANEKLQIVSLVTSLFEIIDKVKSGQGSDAPIGEMMNAMNERVENTHITSVEDVTEYGANPKTITTNKSAMESAGINALYGGGVVNPNDVGVKNMNFSSFIYDMFTSIGSSPKSFEVCLGAKIAAAGIGVVATGFQVLGCIAGIVSAPVPGGQLVTATVGTTSCGALAASVAGSIAAGALLAELVAKVVQFLTPVVTSFLIRDLIANIGGEDLGNAVTSGANMYMGGAHQVNGGSLASREKYVEFAMAQQEVIAENARYERANLSPFDITSKYTFMGTLLTSMMGLMHSGTLMSTLSSGSKTMANSIVAMSPTASAYDISEGLPKMEQYEETCPYLASIGAIGDAFCNPYFITDMDTMSVDPGTIINEVNSRGEGKNFEDKESEDGNVVINKSSDLAKYITFCTQRDSSWGVADYNIATRVTGENFWNSGISGTISGNIPIVGDIIEIVDDKKQWNNLGYILGGSCVAGNNVDFESSPNWETAKYYQRFIEDQALAESMGLIEKSAVTAYLEEYYEENPLDESYEGMLARYSGMSKEDVVAILDIIDYYNYIANYDPTTRYGYEAAAEQEPVQFELEDEVKNPHYVLFEQISFADVRNRNYAA